MKRVLTLCVFITLLTAISLPAYSAEIYIWIDENGEKHITDKPPEKPAKMIGNDTYKRDSPQEIQRYQSGQKANEQKREVELRQRQQANQAQQEAPRVDDSQNKRAGILAEIAKIEGEIQKLNDRERSRSSDRSYYSSPERSANLRQAAYLKEKALMLRRSIEGVNQPEKAQKSSNTKSQGIPDTRSPSDFLPKVGKYRWQIEDSSSTSPKSPSDFLPKAGKYRWQVE
jgi:hypothetical protein